MTKTSLSMPAQETQIVILNSKSLDQHPAMIYPAELRSQNSRYNTQRHLNTIAHVLGAVENITIDQTNGRDKKLR